MSAEERKYRAQDDIRTLQRAEEIKRDTTRVRAAQSEARRQVQDLQKVVKKRAK